MPSIVVPFRAGKTRLEVGSEEARKALVLAMLGDVLSACLAVGETVLVSADEAARRLAAELGAEALDDPGGGQGAAVAAALARLGEGPVLVVNGDLPCAVPHDLRALERAVPESGLAVVAAADGTTNALGLAGPELFAPLYGPGSAEEFRSHASQLGVASVSAAIPNLADDVDTLADLDRVELRAGPRTQAALAVLGQEAPR